MPRERVLEKYHPAPLPFRLWKERKIVDRPFFFQGQLRQGFLYPENGLILIRNTAGCGRLPAHKGRELQHRLSCAAWQVILRQGKEG